MNYVYYHSADLDGHCAGAIAGYYFKKVNQDAKLVPFNYKDDIDLSSFTKKDTIYFVDVVPSPYTRLYDLEKQVGKIIIYDHHKSFIDSEVGKYFREKEGNLLKMDQSGCQLTWEGLFPYTKMPKVVYLLGEYDRWNNSDIDVWENEILPFQYGIRLEATDPNEDLKYWITWFVSYATSDARVTDTVDIGKSLLKYEQNQNERIMGSSFEYHFTLKDKVYKCLCVNSTTRNSMLFKSKWDELKYDAMVVYSQTKNGEWSFSGYTTNTIREYEVDVSKIAESFKGGGHKQAAGWYVKNLSDFFSDVKK